LVRSSVLSQEIGWEECLRNDLFCVGWSVKPSLNQSVGTKVRITVHDSAYSAFLPTRVMVLIHNHGEFL